LIRWWCGPDWQFSFEDNVSNRVLFVSLILVRNWLSLCLVLSCLVHFEISEHAGFMSWSDFVQKVGMWNLCKKVGSYTCPNFTLLYLFCFLILFSQDNGKKSMYFAQLPFGFIH